MSEMRKFWIVLLSNLSNDRPDESFRGPWDSAEERDQHAAQYSQAGHAVRYEEGWECEACGKLITVLRGGNRLLCLACADSCHRVTGDRP